MSGKGLYPNWERDTEIVRLRESGLTYRAIGERYSLCGTRVMQIVFIQQRRQREHDKLERMELDFARRADMRYLFGVLPMIERAAKKASRDNQAIAKLQERFPHTSCDTLWSVLILDREHKRQLARECPSPKPRWYTPTIFNFHHLTQEKRREIAKRLHWSEVIYRAGTDEIVALERRDFRS